MKTKGASINIIHHTSHIKLHTSLVSMRMLNQLTFLRRFKNRNPQLSQNNGGVKPMQQSATDYVFHPKDSLVGAQMLFVAFGALVLVPLLTG